MRKLTHEEILTKQKENRLGPSISVTVVLDDIRSLHNVGSIFRTADGAGIEKVWLCGITGYPPSSQISKTALGAEERVDWDHEQDILKVVRSLKAEGYQIILLEQMDESIPFEDWVPQGKTCLILGNEVEGVSEELSALADCAIEIEMTGLKNSLNVGVAFGVIAYHCRKHLRCPAHA